MNKIIIAGICGFIAGAAGGYFGCHIIEKRNIDKKISDEVQKTLDEIRGHQKEKVMENQEKKDQMIKTTGRDVYAIPHFTATDIVKDIISDEGYGKKEEEVKEPEEKPDDDLPFEIGEVEQHNIWDEKEPEVDNSVSQEDYQAEQDSKAIDEFLNNLDISKAPYPITDEQYNNDFTDEAHKGAWDKVTLIFFTDNVFAERAAYNEFTVMSATETELAIGKDNMKRFVEDRSLGRMFIRNNKLQIDYEIVRSPRSYSSALHEDEEE